MIAKLRKCFQHNQGVFVSMIICVVLLAWTFSCESRVQSLSDTEKFVTRAELELEVQELAGTAGVDPNMLYARAKMKFDKLDRDDAIKKELFDFAALSAESGGVQTTGIITLIGSILGVGFAVDNRIKDKVIKNRPLKA